MRLLSLLLIFAITAAGCASPAPEPAPLEVETGPDTGAIRGVVVDESIAPIAGATIGLKAQGINVTTTNDGIFVIEDLEPGIYFLEASADRFLPIQQTVTVTAGAVAEATISLRGDPTPEPYQATLVFKGHMTVSDIYAVWYATYYLGNTTLCQCIFTFDVEPAYLTTILQGDWTPSIDVTEEHVLYWELWGVDEAGKAATYLSPMETLRVSGASFGEGDSELTVQVSSSETPDIEQSFDGYLTLFYVDPAPDGWSFGA